MESPNTNLSSLKYAGFTTRSGYKTDISLTLEAFGRELGEAPVVLVNHALTGNSHVTGEGGWWNPLIGPGKCIDTRKYSILAFNIPGNGYDGALIEEYKEFVAADIARLFNWGVRELGIRKLFAIIGGSLGGGLAWEMAALDPGITEHLIPLAADWKSTDWLIANCQIQEQILNNSSQPVHDARMHAMLCYRTPESFNTRFQRTTHAQQQVFNVESWLLHHGSKLEGRFELAAYKLVNQLLKTIDITRHGVDVFDRMREAGMRIHIVSVNSDLFFTARENLETYRRLAQADRLVTYSEVQSMHGHDAFLMEFEQLESILNPVFSSQQERDALRVLKFGGHSLSNGTGLEQVVEIVRSRWKSDEQLLVVVSARGNATKELIDLLEKARTGQDYRQAYEDFCHYQRAGNDLPQLENDFQWILSRLEGVALSGDYSERLRDDFVARGELLSGRLLTELFTRAGVPGRFFDARELLLTDRQFGFAKVLEGPSAQRVNEAFRGLDKELVPVVTGFLGSTNRGETTTLGRNGSNYTASLLANFLDAAEVINYTHVNGIYTADPRRVSEARLIPEISFDEANELVQSGIQILHSKTILPLIEKNIPLRICNTFDPDGGSTYISSRSSDGGIKALSFQEDLSLIALEGKGLVGKVGIDARIFETMRLQEVSVGIVSQGASERGIGLVVDRELAERAREALEREFSDEIHSGDINRIQVKSPVSVISVVGQSLDSIDRPFNALIRNKVRPLLFNNTITGRQISLLVGQEDLIKAMNVLHGQLFGSHKRINLFVIGHGNVGGTLIDQILLSRESLRERRSMELTIAGIGNSRQLLLDPAGIGQDWRDRMADQPEVTYGPRDLIAFANAHHLENRILIDNSASEDVISAFYEACIREGFDLVSSNKIANTLGYDRYLRLREVLAEHQKQYLYETNVGAGLPLIDTIKLLHMSGENITHIRGVFSGSLSYIFNRFSVEDKPFSTILREALKLGYTEPDPREDLSGMDVGRKLLILARELALANEFDEIEIQNLIPEELLEGNREAFLQELDRMDSGFDALKRGLIEGHVLRYVGELSGDLQQDKARLEARLVEVPSGSPLGQVSGADSIIEIYTESYAERPLVVQGPGAGAAVTARGVFGDILRIAQTL